MATALVIGARGMLGHAVREVFSRRGYRVVGLGRAEFDIAREPVEKLGAYLGQIDLAVNCAGVTKVALSSLSVEEVLRVNGVFPRNLARLCGSRGIPCFHVTTNAVYRGDRGRYSESDPFYPTDLYGLSKLAGESGECMVLRTSIIGEDPGRRSLLEWARSRAGQEVDGFTNHLWNGVTTVSLAEGLHAILSKGLYLPKIVHVHSPETMSKYELLRLISATYGLDLRIRPTEAPTGSDLTLASIHPLSAQIFGSSLAEQLREMRQLFSGGGQEPRE
jgi:dTDP-4-dehydrorhamnose reductase